MIIDYYFCIPASAIKLSYCTIVGTSDQQRRRRYQQSNASSVKRPVQQFGQSTNLGHLPPLSPMAIPSSCRGRIIRSLTYQTKPSSGLFESRLQCWHDVRNSSYGWGGLASNPSAVMQPGLRRQRIVQTAPPPTRPSPLFVRCAHEGGGRRKCRLPSGPAHRRRLPATETRGTASQYRGLTGSDGRSSVESIGRLRS